MAGAQQSRQHGFRDKPLWERLARPEPPRTSDQQSINSTVSLAHSSTAFSVGPFLLLLFAEEIAAVVIDFAGLSTAFLELDLCLLIIAIFVILSRQKCMVF
ncbi:hypothetical protein MHYP_G00072320 [Metynnis hypsauchen]